MNLRSTWTDERITDLKRMYADGLSAGQIARALGGGVTRNAVCGKIVRLNLSEHAPRPPRPPSEKRPSMRGNRSNPGGLALKIAAGTLGKKTVAAVKPRPEPPKPPEEMRMLGIMDLTETTCKWPLGDGPFLFCGIAKPVEAGPYCPWHRSLAYVPAIQRAERVAA